MLDEDAHADLTAPSAPTPTCIDFDTSLTPRVDVVLDRTPFTTWGGYGGLTLRGAEPVVRHQAPARATAHRISRCTGCERRGAILSSATRSAMALFDHPTNPRHPMPWYGSTKADTYGEGWANFVNAAFLWDEPLTVTAGDSLRLRYRIVVHDGAWDAPHLDAVAVRGVHRHDDRPPRHDGRNPFADDMAETTVAWSDQWYDADAGLLWNPPGSFGGVLADRVRAPGAAVGLVRRRFASPRCAGRPRTGGDRDRGAARACSTTTSARCGTARSPASPNGPSRPPTPSNGTTTTRTGDSSWARPGS